MPDVDVHVAGEGEVAVLQRADDAVAGRPDVRRPYCVAPPRSIVPPLVIRMLSPLAGVKLPRFQLLTVFQLPLPAVQV